MNCSRPTPNRIIDDIKEHLDYKSTWIIAPFTQEKDCGTAFKVYIDGWCGDYAIEVRFSGIHRVKLYQYVSRYESNSFEYEIKWDELLSTVHKKYSQQKLNTTFAERRKYLKDIIAAIVFDHSELFLHLGSEVDIWGRFSGHVSGKFGEYDIYVWRRGSSIRVNHFHQVWEVVCSFPISGSLLFHLIQDNY